MISSSAHNYGIWWYPQRSGAGGNPSFLNHDLFPKLFDPATAPVGGGVYEANVDALSLKLGEGITEVAAVDNILVGDLWLLGA